MNQLSIASLITLLILVGTVVGAPAPATAMPVSYEVTIPIDQGPLTGTTLHANFVIDGNILNAGDREYYDYAHGLGVEQFSMSFNGNNYSRANVDAGYLQVKGGRLTAFTFGAAPSGIGGIDAYIPDDDFLLAQGAFLYTLGSDSGDNRVYFVDFGPPIIAIGIVTGPAPVAEPPAVLLVLLGLGGLFASIRESFTPKPQCAYSRFRHC